MNKHTVSRIICGILSVSAMTLTAGCKGQTTYLSPESSDPGADTTVSAAQESTDPASAEESSQPEQSSSPEQSSAPEESTEAPQSSAEPAVIPESSEAAPVSTPDDTDLTAVPSAFPTSAADVPENDKNNINTKTLSMASAGAVKDSAPSSSPKFTSMMEAKKTGEEDRLIGAVYTDYGSYSFSMAEQQRSSGTVYIRAVYDDPDATYIQCFLEKGGRTYLLDESGKIYYAVTESDVNSGPYKTVMSLTESFPELTESGTCPIDGETASYEIYKGTGETFIAYWNGDKFIKGEIYSADTLAGLVYFDFSRNVSSSLTSIPSDYTEG